MKLRIASRSDVHTIATIHAMSWRHNYQGSLSAAYLADIAPKDRADIWHNRLSEPKANQYVLLAEMEGEIMGFACAYLNENPTWGTYLDNLHVRRDVQSKGIGKALLLGVVAASYRQDAESGMCLIVNQTNEKAQSFYQSLGARNAENGVWNAPDGSVIPTYWYVWDRLHALYEMTQMA